MPPAPVYPYAMALKRYHPNDSNDRVKVNPADLEEGDRVFMGIAPHGTTDGLPDAEYDTEVLQSGVEGQVTKALSETASEVLRNGDTPMADLKVTTDNGHVYTWNVDNGYIIGTHEEYGLTDVGKVAGFYEPSG